MLKCRIVFLVLLATFVAAPMLFGQGADMGAIQGTVTDKSGAVVPGVTITIKNLATAFERVVVSEGSGAYRFPGLGPGTYSLKAELSSFTTFEVKSVLVNVGRTTDVNVQLEPAGTNETIMVSEIASLVESTKTDVGGVVDNREVTNLPLNGRNFSSLATLVPGARPVTGWEPSRSRVPAGATSIRRSTALTTRTIPSAVRHLLRSDVYQRPSVRPTADL